MPDISRAIRIEAIGTDKVVAQLKDLAQQGDTALTNVSHSATRAATAFDTVGAKAGGFSNTTRYALGNVSQQIQDVFVQLEGGTNKFTILIQQGPQIASAFGPVGAIIGAVGVVAGVAAQAFFGMGKEAEGSTKALDLVSAATSDATTKIDTQVDAIRKQTEETRRNTAATIENAKAKSTIAAGDLAGKLAGGPSLLEQLAGSAESADSGLAGVATGAGPVQQGVEEKTRRAGDLRAQLVSAVKMGDRDGAIGVLEAAGVKLGTQTVNDLLDLADQNAMLRVLADEAAKPGSSGYRTASDKSGGSGTGGKAGAPGASADRQSASDAERDAALLARLAEQTKTVTDARQAYIDQQLQGLSKSASADDIQEATELAGQIYDLTEKKKADAEADRQRLQAQQDVDNFMRRVSPTTEKVGDDIARLNELYALGKISAEDYGSAADELARRQVEAQRRIREAIVRTSSNPFQGIQAGLEDYAGTSKSIAENTRDATVQIAGGIEDALVNAAKGGKEAFADMANAIIEDLARIAIRMTITQPLAQAGASVLSSWFGGSTATATATSNAGSAATLDQLYGVNVQHDGSLSTRRFVDPQLFVGAPRFHNGLRADEYPAILQRGEQVIPRGGSADGGVSVTLNNQTGVQMDQPEVKRGGTNGRELEITLRKMIVDTLGNGAADGTMRRRYGLSNRVRA